MRIGKFYWFAAEYPARPNACSTARSSAQRESSRSAFTMDPTDAPLLRMLVEPTDRNGLSTASRLMIDKTTTVPKARLGKRIGKLSDEDSVRLNRALTVFLGLAR
jgi:PemK-like, MazF-like toxin of type II toxin-antitoxin system